MYVKFWKRLFDLTFSLIALFVLALPMVCICVMVRLTSKGPGIFTIERVGKDLKPIRFYKFRTMWTHAPKDCAPRLLDATQFITPFGAFLRKTSLDELPQLICVLKGDMSLIGPRPCGWSEGDLIMARRNGGAFGVLPGITGWAQINGRDELAKDVERKASFDSYYAKHLSFKLDMKIFFATIKKVLLREDIAEGTAAAASEITPLPPLNLEPSKESDVAATINNDGDGVK